MNEKTNTVQTPEEKAKAFIDTWLDELNNHMYSLVTETTRELSTITSTMTDDQNLSILLNSHIKPWSERNEAEARKTLSSRARSLYARSKNETVENLSDDDKTPEEFQKQSLFQAAAYEVTRLLLRGMYGNEGFGSGNCTAIPIQTLMHGHNNPYKFLIYTPLKNPGNLPDTLFETIRKIKLQWVYQQMQLNDSPEHADIKKLLENLSINGTDLDPDTFKRESIKIDLMARYQLLGLQGKPEHTNIQKLLDNLSTNGTDLDPDTFQKEATRLDFMLRYQQLNQQNSSDSEHAEIKDLLKRWIDQADNTDPKTLQIWTKDIEAKYHHLRSKRKQETFPLDNLLSNFVSLLPKEDRSLDLNDPDSPILTDRYLNLSNPTTFAKKMLALQDKILKMQDLFKELPQDEEALKIEIGKLAHRENHSPSSLEQLLNLLPEDWPNRNNFDNPNRIIEEIQKLEQRFGNLKKFVHQTDDTHDFAQVFAENNVGKGASVIMVLSKSKPDKKADPNAPSSPEGMKGSHMITCTGFAKQPDGKMEPLYTSFDYESKNHILSPKRQCGYVIDLPYLVRYTYEMQANNQQCQEQTHTPSLRSNLVIEQQASRSKPHTQALNSKLNSAQSQQTDTAIRNFKLSSAKNPHDPT